MGKEGFPDEGGVATTAAGQRPRIAEFLSGKYVLVTGGSGFMGKVLIEKLFRSCPSLGGIFVLVRPKRGKDVSERVADILKSPLFSVLEAKHPGLAQRLLLPIGGDVTEVGLGLSPADRALLQDKVHIVFHGAATVRFDDPLKSAVIMNVRGTREMAELAVGMKRLQVFVHMSTTYCNTDRPVCDEIVYPPHADWREMIAAVESLPGDQLDIITAKLLQRLPNTYTFSKSMGEHCVYSYRDKIPLVIFRPSIVISAVEEPLPGWVDNFNGPVGLIAASGKGLVQLTLAKADVVADYIPVDIAIKAIIASAWERATSGAPAPSASQAGPESAPVPAPAPARVDVYNCSSAAVRPMSMAELVAMAKPIANEVPLDNVLWPPYAMTTGSRTVLLIGTLFLHMLPALLIDTVLRLQGKQPRLCRIQRRIYAAQEALAPFLTRSWTFLNYKTMDLFEKILPEDSDEFFIDLRGVDVKAFFHTVTLGGRRYLFHEKDEDLPKAKAHLQRMLMIDRIVRGLLLALVLYWALRLELYMLPINVISFLLTL